MSEHYDAAEIQRPSQRETDLFARLPAMLAHAATAPGWARHLAGFDLSAVRDRARLAALPLLRKSDLMRLQHEAPPFGGFAVIPLGRALRLMMSPGPIFEPQGSGEDAYGAARALFAAGVRSGDIVHNAFAYHFTPGGFILESGAHALGCSVIAAGPGSTAQQLDAISHYRPSAYVGTPDFLKILIDAAGAADKDASSLRRALVSGAALPASLRAELQERGVAVSQCYAVAELGVIAYEIPAEEGMIINENLIVEIVIPGSGEPVADGEVGEVVVTTFNRDYPMIRLATGDLSAVLDDPSPCGRTNMRIAGWMGRADQTTKVKGMFVRPEQVAEIARRHPQLGRLRLVISRNGEQDAMLLRVEGVAFSYALEQEVLETLQAVTRLRGTVELVPPGSLPNDGKVIADERGTS